MITHTVLPGECLASIAEKYGFTNPQVVYDHPANESLRRARPDPNVLLAGDQVVIPDRRLRTVTGGTEQRYQFTVDRQPTYLRLKLEDAAGKPRAGLPYRVEFRDQVRTGTTASDGSVTEVVPPDLPAATLVIIDHGAEERYTVALGYLDPVTHPDGLKQRLRALGYYVDVPGVPDDVLLRAAVHAFQHANDQPTTGVPDHALYARLKDEYCS